MAISIVVTGILPSAGARALELNQDYRSQPMRGWAADRDRNNDVSRAISTQGPRVWHAPDGMHIDVRGLSPPEPMLAILQMIEGGEEDALSAHLDREPIFLDPELDQRGWTYEIISCMRDGGDREVKLRLARLSV